MFDIYIEVIRLPFRKLYETLKKPAFLRGIFDDLNALHELTEATYLLAMNSFFEHDASKARKVLANEEKIDSYQRKIRSRVVEYLAVNMAPDISSSLVIISIVIDYERIGDNAKNIAQLVYDYELELNDNEYLKDVKSMHDIIRKNFKFSIEAFMGESGKLALKAIDKHNQVKDIHYGIIKALIKDEEISVREGIVIGLLTGFIRRINAHVNNIDTAVVQPFHRIGFEPK